MNVTAWALRNDRITWFCILCAALFGLMSYQALPQAEDPGFVFRSALVTTVFPGASPERVEQLVTAPLEAKIQEIPQLDVVRSTSRTGRSEIFVDIHPKHRDMRPIWDDLRRKVESVEDELPADVIGPFVNDELGTVYGVVLALVAEGYSEAERAELAKEVREDLLALDDAARVTIDGLQERRIELELDQAKLADLELSPRQLQSILAAQNIVTPGGVVVAGPEQIALEPSGSFASVEDLARTVIQVPSSTAGGRDLVVLGDVARIVEGTVDPPEPRVRYMGERALSIAVSLPPDGHVDRLGHAIDALVERFHAEQPIGVELHRVSFSPDDVRASVRIFLWDLAQAVVIVMLVMVPVLGLRTGLVVSTGIPLSLCATFVLMRLTGTGVDTISLAALLIALGMNVDNMIVMSESVLLGMREGKSASEAAIEAARELTTPMFVSAATTATSFLPIYLAKSITGEYAAPLFTVVAMALLSSWVMSITLVPLMCRAYLKVPEDYVTPPRVERFFELYRRFLLDVLRRPWRTVAASTVALGIALAVGAIAIDRIFFPPSAKASFGVELTLQPGATLDETERVVAEVDGWIRRELLVGDERPEGVVSWAAYVGQSAPRYQLPYPRRLPSDDIAYFKLETTSRAIVDELAPRLEAHVHDTHPDVLASAGPLSVGPPAGKPVAVRIRGPDPDRLMALAATVEDRLAAIAGTRNVGNDWGRRTKKLDVRVDPVRARLAGVSNADVALSLQTLLSGLEVTEYREEDEVFPVILRSGAADRDIGRIESLNVFNLRTGATVPLKQVADLQLVFEAPKILRRDLQRSIEVFAEVRPGVTAAEIMDELRAFLQVEARDWEPEYRWSVGGEADLSRRSSRSILAGAPIAAFVMTALLVFQFNSIRLVAINLLALPYGLIGVVFGLLIAGSYFGFMTLLGVVSLFGIVLNNANLLIDRIDVEIRVLGRPPVDAILEASTRRLSPILLTTGTNIAGLVPLWFGGGPVFEPMAVSLLFGLVFCTAMTLALVPAMSAIAYGVRAPADGEPAPAPILEDETEWVKA